MSIDIHISNYEEYLCSYVDGELSPEEITALELFLDRHPHLRTELNQLMATRLQPEDLVFANKAALYKSSQPEAENYESRLLSYMDGELDEQAAKELELFMEAHPALRQELNTWEKTRVVPDMTVRFEDKSVLYRHNSRTVRMRPAYWWAAAAMLAGALFLLRNTFTQDDAGVPVAATSGTSAKPEGDAAGTQPVLAQEDGNAVEGSTVQHAGADNAAGNSGAIAGNTGAREDNAGGGNASNASAARGNNAVSNNSLAANTATRNAGNNTDNALAGANARNNAGNTAPNNTLAANTGARNTGNNAVPGNPAVTGNRTAPAVAANNVLNNTGTAAVNSAGSVPANNALAAAPDNAAAELSGLRTRSAPVRNLRQNVNTDLSGDIPEVKDHEMLLAMNNKPSIDIKTAANLATAAPAPPPGELIMSVTGNGLESKVLDKVTNVAKLFSRKRNNK